MRGNVDLLRSIDGPEVGADPAAREERAATIDEIEAGLDRITTLIDELLILARADADAPEVDLVPTDLAEAAALAVDPMASLAALRGVTIGLDISPVTVNGDAERLEQLVVLLLDNAIRHAREGGTSRVSVRREGDVAVLEIEDDGPGIGPGDEAHVFDRFWRAADAPEGGSGLGLSIAAWIVGAHGGRIAAENRAEGGARFRVTLPAA